MRRSNKRKSLPKTKKVEGFRKYVVRLIKYFRQVTGGAEYNVTVAWEQSIDENGALASIGIDTKYLEANVRVSKRLRKFYENKDYRSVAATICHEFCHILTEPLYEWAVFDAAPSQKEEIEKVRERQTERISTVVMGLVPRGVWRPKT